jgi:hypothetical protein
MRSSQSEKRGLRPVSAEVAEAGRTHGVNKAGSLTSGHKTRPAIDL